MPGVRSRFLEDFDDMVDKGYLISANKAAENFSVVERGRTREVVGERHLVAHSDHMGF